MVNSNSLTEPLRAIASKTQNVWMVDEQVNGGLVDEPGQHHRRCVYFPFYLIDRFTPSSYNSLWPNSGPVSATAILSSLLLTSFLLVLVFVLFLVLVLLPLLLPWVVVALFDCDQTKAALGRFFLLGKPVERRCPIV